MSKITVGRALASRLVRRAVRLATIVVGIIFAVLFCVIWAVAYFFSPWWWLLLLPLIFFTVVFLLLRLIVLLIVGRVHAEKLTVEQREGLDDFADKIQGLIEARATPPWLFALITIKDIVIHHDITTIKKLISDSVNLRHDYQELEKLF